MNKQISLLFFLLVSLVANAQFEVGGGAGIRFNNVITAVGEDSHIISEFKKRTGAGAFFHLKYTRYYIEPVIRLDYSNTPFFWYRKSTWQSITKGRFDFHWASLKIMGEAKIFKKAQLYLSAGISLDAMVYGTGTGLVERRFMGNNYPYRIDILQYKTQPFDLSLTGVGGISYGFRLNERASLRFSALYPFNWRHLSERYGSLLSVKEYQVNLGLYYMFKSKKMDNADASKNE